MKILVTSPDGHIGRRVLAELVGPEFSVRVIARNPWCLPEQIREQVEVVRGSIDDSQMLRKALEGVEALFWCVPLGSVKETNIRADYERFAQAGSHAIREAGTPRVIAISGIGNVLGGDGATTPGVCATEDILNKSGAAIRHLRCGWFMENFLRQARWICRHGMFVYPMPEQIALPMVAAADVAELVLKGLVRRDWASVKSISVFGPEDLCFNQAASILERVLDRPVRYAEVSADHFVRELVRSGTSVKYARNMAAMFAILAQGSPREATPTPGSVTLTTLARWAKVQLLPTKEAFCQSDEPLRQQAAVDNAESELSFLSHGI
jgi:uncharacterized protein YbjT (DUF2867 family)